MQMQLRLLLLLFPHLRHTNLRNLNILNGKIQPKKKPNDTDETIVSHLSLSNIKIIAMQPLLTIEKIGMNIFFVCSQIH